MNEAAVKWLREQVEARLAVAREACHDGNGHWFRRLRPIYLDHPPVPSGALYEGDVPESDEDGDWLYYPEIVVYDEGRPSDEQFAHISANDPRQIIADCEAQLAILGEHRLVVAAVHACYAGSNYLENWSVAHDPPSPEDLARLAPGVLEAHCRRCRCPFPCWDILNLMTTYRHHPGYAEQAC